MYGDPKICPSAKACLEWIQIKQMADRPSHAINLIKSEVHCKEDAR